MMSQDKVTSHFKQTKKSTADAGVGKTRAAGREAQARQALAEPRTDGEQYCCARESSPPDQGALDPPTPPVDLDLTPEERMLRAFDLATKYGPCAGVTRMERWQRAEKFGLDPPAEVLAILNKYGPGHDCNNNVWYNRI